MIDLVFFGISIFSLAACSLGLYFSVLGGAVLWVLWDLLLMSVMAACALHYAISYAIYLTGS